jgi:hypothetical protein
VGRWLDSTGPSREAELIRRRSRPHLMVREHAQAAVGMLFARSTPVGTCPKHVFENS